MRAKNASRNTNGRAHQVASSPPPQNGVALSSSGVIAIAEEPRGLVLLDAIPAMLFTSGPDGRWDYVHPQVCAYTGRSEVSLQGLGWAEVLHPDDVAPCLAQWQEEIQYGQPFSMKQRLHRADGTYHWFCAQCAPQRSPAGAINCWAGIYMPIEAEKELETERALRHDAELAVDDRDSFVAVVAHELRMPLTMLLGYTKLLQMRLANREGAEPGDRQLVDILVGQTLRLSHLLNALLDVTLIGHEQLVLASTMLDIVALVHQVAEELQLTLPSSKLKLHGADAPLWVMGDRLRLEQVLLNLLQNAMKYSTKGGEIVIQVTPSATQVSIAVIDRGIGIAASARPYLFQRFYRAGDRDVRYVPGLGIGLYVCKAIVDLHGGTIEVESIEGKGSTFTLLLPRIRPRPMDEPGGP